MAVSKEQFAQRVRSAFDAIMAAGGVTPNEAAVLALKRVRAQAVSQHQVADLYMAKSSL